MLYSSTSDVTDEVTADDIAANMKDITTPLPLKAGMSMTTALQVMNYNIKAALTIDHPVSIVICMVLANCKTCQIKHLQILIFVYVIL